MATDMVAITEAVLTAVLKIACLVFVGMKLEAQGFLNDTKRKCLSGLAMDICLPCLLFSSVLPEADVGLMIEGWPLLLWPFGYAIVGALLGVICCMATGIPSQHLGAAAACAAFPNVNGFPVAIISALGNTIPRSPAGFSAMTFLSLIQLTDGVVKYTLAPAVFKRDLRAIQRRHRCSTSDEPQSCTSQFAALPLGASLKSISADTPTNNNEHTDFGLSMDQVRVVEPEFSRFDAYMLFRAPVKVAKSLKTGSMRAIESGQVLFQQSLLAKPNPDEKGKKRKAVMDFFVKLFPPQVVAVLAALLIGVAPDWLKALLYRPPEESPAVFGFVYGTAKELGGGFVPLQMITLGGRLLNMFGDSGPLSARGSAGPGGRSKLLRISAAVGVARMVLTPLAMFGLAYLSQIYFFDGKRKPLAFWSPAFIVAAMPTANNISTMADLAGSGRSISSASTAMQLLASPVILTLTLMMMLTATTSTLSHDNGVI